MPHHMTAEDAQLAERVYQAVAQEHPTGHSDPRLLLHDRPPGSSLTERELDLLDWGWTYGIAYALARLEAHPFEPDEHAAQRADRAAWAAFARFGTNIADRDDDENGKA